MTWTKSPDDYPDRLLDLSDAAYRLHHAATVYANRVGLDGRIPKSRLTLVPVPQKTRRPAVVRELRDAGLWREDHDYWELVDFFDAQLSADEVSAQRHYDAIRQRVRFAKDDQTKADLRAQEDAAKRDLFDARERRRARASQRETHRDSQRPVPLYPVPPRPDPNEDEGEDEQGTVGALGGRAPAPSNERCPECGNGLTKDRTALAVMTPFNGSPRWGEAPMLVHEVCAERALTWGIRIQWDSLTAAHG